MNVASEWSVGKGRHLKTPVVYKRTFTHFMTTGATEKSVHSHSSSRSSTFFSIHVADTSRRKTVQKAGLVATQCLEACMELASSPGPKRGPGTHCLCMRQSVPRISVHCILLEN